MSELGVSVPRSSSATMVALIRDTLMLRLQSRRVRIDADVELISDERGVRIAREEAD